MYIISNSFEFTSLLNCFNINKTICSKIISGGSSSSSSGGGSGSGSGSVSGSGSGSSSSSSNCRRRGIGRVYMIK